MGVTTPALEVQVGSMILKNPVSLASGTCAFGSVLEGFFDVSALGALTTKGCSAEPWTGNPAPRMCKTPSGIMNSVGLANPGIRAMLAEQGAYLQKLEALGTRVIIQIAGHTEEEFIQALELVEELAPWASAVEVNVSCPNLAHGGKLIGGTPQDAEHIVSVLRPRTQKTLFVKIAPLSVSEISRACEAAGADALSLINTINAMSIDIYSKKSKVSRPTAGLSGPAIHPIAVRMVWEAAQAVSIPLNAMGGVDSFEAAAEMILAGAHMVSVGTANFYQPTLSKEIVEAFPQWLDYHKVQSVRDLIGGMQQ